MYKNAYRRVNLQRLLGIHIKYQSDGLFGIITKRKEKKKSIIFFTQFDKLIYNIYTLTKI